VKIGGCSEFRGQSELGRAKEQNFSKDNKVKPGMEKGPEVVAAKQDKVQDKETEIRAKTVASSYQQPNRTVRSSKLDHPVSLGLVENFKYYRAWDNTGTLFVSSRFTPSQRGRI
jgi:hypothetical protein